MLDSASGQPAALFAGGISAEVRESMRLRKLDSLAVLDTSPEPEFDQLTVLAAVVCAAPAALMCLADADRLWFKSQYGLTRPDALQANSVGTEALSDQDIGDTLLAAHPELSFYAGAPLVTTDGYFLGALRFGRTAADF